MNINIDVLGMDRTLAYLRRAAENAAKIKGLRILVGSNLKYAFGIEYGRHRGGRLARRAGGAFMLKKGFDAIQDSLKRDVSRAVENDGDVYEAAFRNALRAEAVAKENTPVVKGGLRRSFHTVSEGR